MRVLCPVRPLFGCRKIHSLLCKDGLLLGIQACILYALSNLLHFLLYLCDFFEMFLDLLVLFYLLREGSLGSLHRFLSIAFAFGAC